MCYMVPAAAAIVTTFMWKKNNSFKLWQLTLLFYGGALFGVVDHLWNGELFFISKNWLKDIFLGVVITLATIAVWRLIVSISRNNPNFASIRKPAV